MKKILIGLILSCTLLTLISCGKSETIKQGYLEDGQTISSLFEVSGDITTKYMSYETPTVVEVHYQRTTDGGWVTWTDQVGPAHLSHPYYVYSSNGDGFPPIITLIQAVDK